MTFSELLVNFGPIVLLIAMLVVFMILMARRTGRFTQQRAQEAREMRQAMETLVVPELRAIRGSIDAATAELKLSREQSQRHG